MKQRLLASLNRCRTVLLAAPLAVYVLLLATVFGLFAKVYIDHRQIDLRSLHLLTIRLLAHELKEKAAAYAEAEKPEQLIGFYQQNGTTFKKVRGRGPESFAAPSQDLAGLRIDGASYLYLSGSRAGAHLLISINSEEFANALPSASDWLIINEQGEPIFVSDSLEQENFLRQPVVQSFIRNDFKFGSVDLSGPTDWLDRYGFFTKIPSSNLILFGLERNTGAFSDVFYSLRTPLVIVVLVGCLVGLFAFLSYRKVFASLNVIREQARYFSVGRELNREGSRLPGEFQELSDELVIIFRNKQELIEQMADNKRAGDEAHDAKSA